MRRWSSSFVQAPLFVCSFSQQGDLPIAERECVEESNEIILVREMGGSGDKEVQLTRGSILFFWERKEEEVRESICIWPSWWETWVVTIHLLSAPFGR